MVDENILHAFNNCFFMKKDLALLYKSRFASKPRFI